MHILLVEDNIRMAITLADGLAEDGHTVEVVGTAAAAIERGVRGDFDLMVLDLGLPDWDVLEVLHDLRAQRVLLPVVVLTARDHADARDAALAAGAAGYAVKPFAFAELLARLAAVMGGAK